MTSSLKSFRSKSSERLFLAYYQLYIPEYLHKAQNKTKVLTIRMPRRNTFNVDRLLTKQNLRHILRHMMEHLRIRHTALCRNQILSRMVSPAGANETFEFDTRFDYYSCPSRGQKLARLRSGKIEPSLVEFVYRSVCGGNCESDGNKYEFSITRNEYYAHETIENNFFFARLAREMWTKTRKDALNHY